MYHIDEKSFIFQLGARSKEERAGKRNQQNSRGSLEERRMDAKEIFECTMVQEAWTVI